MSALTDYTAAAAGDTGANGDTADENFFSLPAVPSYLVGADNHQLGNTGSSLLDPTTWGERVDNGFKFSVSAITRAVASTFNSAVQVGELIGVTDDTDKVSTKEWLQNMDDDLAQYYTRNQSAIDTVGDVAGMFAPGLAGIKVLNWAQKGIASAAEGKAGLGLAASFGTLPTKQAQFAKLAAADIANSTSTYSLINANLAKSLAAGYAQGALEFAAFDVAASSVMRDSPLFENHDVSDIAYNALLGGGFIGAGVMGTAVAARTYMEIKAAGSAVDKATHPWRTVLTEPAESTPANEKLAIHLNNIEAIPTIDTTDPLYKLKLKGTNETKLAELDAGRIAAHTLTKGDGELGNKLFDTFATARSEDASNKLAGVIRVARAGVEVPEEAALRHLSLDLKPVQAKVAELQDKLSKLSVGTSDYAKTELELTKATARLDKQYNLKQLAEESPIAVQYLKLHGDDAGTLYEAPTTLRMADTYSTESALLEAVKSYKHKQGQDWSATAAAGDVNAVEARYIQAQTAPFDAEILIGNKDIPFLERAYQELSEGTIKTVSLKDGTVLDKSGLFHYLSDLKGTEALAIQEANLLAVGEKVLNTHDVAKLVNVHPNYLKGQVNTAKPVEDFFAFQTEAINHTEKQIAAGLWRADKGTIKTYLQPQFAKLVLDTSKAEAISGHEISGMVAIKEQQRIYRQQAINVTDTYLGEAAASYPKEIPGVLMTGANRESVGGGLLTSMNANYKTLGSFVQQIGATTAAKLQKLAEDTATRFAPSGHALLNDPEAGTEFWKVIQQLRQTPEKYELTERGLVNVKQLDYEAAVQNAGGDASKIAQPVFEDARAPVIIPLETDAMRKWAKEWDSYHKEHVTHKTNLRTSQGLNVSNNLARNFYVPPVDGRQFPHFAFVVDDSISGTGHITTIHANTAAELEALAAKVPTESGLKVIYKEQSERFHQAIKDYDYDLGINENYIDSALKRSGVSASYFPRTDPKVLWDDLMGWRVKQDAGLLRDMIEHRYNPEFAELRRQGAQYDLAVNSRVGYVPDFLKARQSNPYTDYIKTALYVQRDDKGVWSGLNRLAETGVSVAVSRLQDTWKTVKSPAELEAINAELKSIGCSAYEDAATYALANHTAPKPVLSNWIRQANSILTTTILRSDPLNAVNNGFGHAVLYGTELPAMIKDVINSGEEGAAAISKLAKVKVPGTPNEIVSPAKLAANAYAAWWDKIIGGSDGGKLYEYFKSINVMPSYTDQFRTMSESLTLRGTESAAELNSKMASAFEAAKKLGDTAERVTGNKFAEEMNRFVAAHTAHEVANIAIARGVLLPELKDSIINTFVNRTQGVALAAQRPLLFKGAVGQAVGLFQTYQFNMLQQLFRYVGEGDRRRVGTLLGLQGSIYGLNGLPGFNAVNNYLVGGAAGNVTNQDIISTTYDVAGKEGGDWLLYGLSSNFMLHPDAKINLYSRGDINPRQVTVIPTNVADVPIVGAASKFFGSIYETTKKINNGADVWSSFLQGVEHSGISRPLSGFAQAMEASTNPAHKVFSTDNAGNIVMQNDLFSVMTAARVLGAKPLDEAVALDAYHRVSVYKEANRKKVSLLGESIKATVAGGNVPSPEQINSFAGEYMKAGGKQHNFAEFYHRQILNANKSKVNQMIENTNNPGSRYMQKIMGGYELNDFINE